MSVEVQLALIGLVGIFIQNYFTSRRANKKIDKMNIIANGTLAAAHKRIEMLEAIIERRNQAQKRIEALEAIIERRMPN